MEAAEIALLQDVLRRESRSLVQYARDAFPWCKAEGQAACDAINMMAADEAEAVARLGRWLARQRVPLTFPGAYPLHFTSLNFIAVPALVSRLIADEERQIAALEKTIAATTQAEARALLDALLVMKQEHLRRLGTLSVSAAPVAPAS